MPYIIKTRTTGEKFRPIAAQNGFQAHKRWQARKILTRFDALQVTHAHAGLFGQFFLSQFFPRPQADHVFAKTSPLRTGFGLARRHSGIVAQRRVEKHEALHRTVRLFILTRNGFVACLQRLMVSKMLGRKLEAR